MAILALDRTLFARMQAEKIQVVKGAEADAESKFLAGQGIARQRQAIINGLRESVKVRVHNECMTRSGYPPTARTLTV